MRYRPPYLLGLVVAALLLTTGCTAQGNHPIKQPRYIIIHPDGREVSRELLLDEASRADVVLVGETHDNPAAHHMEYALFKGLLERRNSEKTPPRVTLSLEMLARDLQPVTDEYLAGLITEMHFMAASRPWGNYGRSYRKTLNLAREKEALVIAANAPRRYVNLVSRQGREALELLSPEAKHWIAPLPYEDASPTYRAKLKALDQRLSEKRAKKPVKNSPHGTAGGEKIPDGINFDAQALWDATMAWSIAETQKQHPESLVMHIAGSFHSEGGLGIPEHLSLYNPSATILIITIKPPQKGDPLPAFRSTLPVREYLILTE